MQSEIVDYLKSLREEIIQKFEELEKSNLFRRKPWTYQKGQGGGENGLIRGDDLRDHLIKYHPKPLAKAVFQCSRHTRRDLVMVL